ncbi:MAG TPA: hypothetical protein VN736_10765 [Candidatus Limnocylindrales bacterium]|nr:hypothetical protein [Candidatus Limnocylindrales bacterium]
MSDRNEILEGWKAIATHLNVGVRTAQEYEKQRGLPVRRQTGQEKARVWAVTTELDDWQRLKLGNVEASTVAPVLADARIEDNGDCDLTNGKVADGPTGVPDSLHLRPFSKWPRRAVAMIIVVPLLLLGWMLIRRPWENREPTRVDLAGRILSMLDQHGWVIWSFELPGRPPKLPTVADYNYAKPLIADLDGDGRKELLYSYYRDETPVGANVLYCFNSDGSVRWTHQLGRELRTVSTSRVYPAEYTLTWIAALNHPTPRGGRIIIGGTRGGTSLFGVEVLTSQGAVVGEYYHPGWLWGEAVMDLDGDGHDEIILAGVNNAYGSLPGFNHPMTVVVLDSRNVDGQGPAPPTDDRHFSGLITGSERAVLFLQDFGALPSDSPNDFCSIHLVSAGQGHLEIVAQRESRPEVAAHYQFDSRLHLEMIVPTPALGAFLDSKAPRAITQIERVNWYRQQLGDIRVLKNEFAAGATSNAAQRRYRFR